MDKTIYRVSLDMASHVSQAVFAAKVGDTAREIRAGLTVGGTPYEIAKGCYAVFTAIKADGNKLYNNCTIDGNEIVYTFTEQTCTAPGRMRCEITLYDAAGKLITSPRFVILVEGEIYNGEVVTSRSEFTKLIDATAAAEQIAAELEEAKENGEFNGPKGDKGDKGDPGERGPKGDKGDPGAALINDTVVSRDSAWSSFEIVDRLCPTFEGKGKILQFEPVEGSTMTFGRPNGNVKVVAIGKNLYDQNTYKMIENKMIRQTSGVFAISSAFSATEIFIPAAHLRGKTIAIRNAPSTTSGTGSSTAGIAFYEAADEKTYITGTDKSTIKVPDNACYMRFSTATNLVGEAQIEIGNTVTDYEAYKNYGTVTIDSIWSQNSITAGSGIHTIYGLDPNDQTKQAEFSVSGKADPVAILKKLTNALLTLGGNV